MALFDRFTRTAGAPTATTGEYLPAQSQGALSGWKGQAGAIVDRAAQVYKQNPKLVGGIALVGLASLLVGMKRGR